MDAQIVPTTDRRRLVFTRADFDDYITALLARIRSNEQAERILSGSSQHPLILYQRIYTVALAYLRISPFTVQQLCADPVGTYVYFSDRMTSALLQIQGPVPNVGDLNQLEADFVIHKAAEKFIYSTIVATLQVGISMHYARSVRHGAGTHLLNTIISDNRQVTTRSLMAIFSALLGLKLKSGEVFEQFARRIDLLIQRLRNWRPPVILPEQLLLFCALRALPAVPFGPVRHIILASPNITYATGVSMLRDVANTGADVINTTLGSGNVNHKPANVLCAPTCPPPASRPTQNHRHKKKKKNKGPSEKCLKDGPCVHHGPGSFHSTEECEDPELKRSRFRQAKKPPSSAVAGVASAGSNATTPPVE